MLVPGELLMMLMAGEFGNELVNGGRFVVFPLCPGISASLLPLNGSSLTESHQQYFKHPGSSQRHLRASELLAARRSQ